MSLRGPSPTNLNTRLHVGYRGLDRTWSTHGQINAREAAVPLAPLFTELTTSGHQRRKIAPRLPAGRIAGLER